MSCAGGVAGAFTPDIVVENTAVGGFVHVRMCKVHPISFNSAGNTADEGHGPVRAYSFDNADMSQGIVQSPVSVEVPCVVKEYQIAGTGSRGTMERSVSTYMVVDQSHPIRSGAIGAAFIEIDPMFQENGSCHTGAVVANAPPFACDRRCSDKRCCRADDV